MSEWMLGGPGRRQQSDEEIRRDGHQITDVAEMFPDQRKLFCTNCGEKTIAPARSVTRPSKVT